MGILDFFRGTWSLDGVERPWQGPSIYEHVRRHIDPRSGELSGAGIALPDENEVDPAKLRWAPGALDGVMGHHAGGEVDQLRVEALLEALEALLSQATPGNFFELYELATSDSLLGIIDALTDRVRDLPSIRPERVHALGSALAREAPHREAVKLGLALLGTIEGANDHELLLELGLHDEFTLFSSAAIVNQEAQAERTLFQLARRVHGWGRIQTVERLSETEDPEVQGWLLRQGFRNSVLDAYLAYTCAVAGQLHTALSARSVDAELLEGAAGIFTALCSGGPARDLTDYPQAAEAVSSWLSHLESVALTPALSVALDALYEREELPGPLRDRIATLKSGPTLQ